MDLNKKIKSNKLNKTGVFYVMDALLASMLLIGAILLIYTTYSPDDIDIDQQTFVSRDILIVLSELRVSELNNSFVTQEIASGNITDTDKTVLDQIGEYWALNKVDKAQMLLQIVVNESIPKNYGVRTMMGNNTLLLQNLTKKVNSVAANRMISGIEQGRPLAGFSGTSYLKKVYNKKTSTYAYFGGFVGQGNVTVKLDLPNDFNSARLIDTTLKIESPGTFALYINAQQCGTTYSGDSGQVSLWNITSCGNLLNSGTNSVLLTYTSQLNTSYISGGFIKATYTTDELIENLTQGYYRYYFPDIDGFINLYDTVSVQGNILNWTLNTTFFNKYQTFFKFGNETIFLTQGNDTVNQNIVYSKYNQLLPQEPIPIRFGVTNFSNITTTISGLPADTFIVTDTSGSMDTCIAGTARNCSYQYRKIVGGTYFPISCIVYDVSTCNNNPDNPCGASPFNRGRNYDAPCNQSRLKVAQLVDNTFVDTILTASPLHSIGLVDYDTRSNSLTPLTSTAATLHSAINGYTTGLYTCTCCGLNRARENLITSGNKKFMILLSDGDANICCRNLTDYVGTGNASSCGVGATDPMDWSIYAGQTACANNITVFTIGFGPDMSAAGRSAMQQTACNSSLYFNANDTVELQEVFDDITQQILLSANFSSQTVTVVGNFTPSKLYGSSYIDLYYAPLTEPIEQNKISIITETLQFNRCNASIFIPPNVDVRDAYVTSYSSNHWTKSLVVNNIPVFNLTNYGQDYVLLGDPFIIQVPSILLQPGANNIMDLVVGDSPSNNSNCSNNNTLIYTALINISTPRTDALEYKTGCLWTIESTNGLFNVSIPAGYSGNKTCEYTTTSISYDPLDVYDVAVYNMLKQLDYEDNGRIFFDLTQNDLEIVLFTTGQIAYMWGPSLMKLEVWQ